MIRRNTVNLHWKAKLNLYKLMVIPVTLYALYASLCLVLNKDVMSHFEIIQRAVEGIFNTNVF